LIWGSVRRSWVAGAFCSAGRDLGHNLEPSLRAAMIKMRLRIAQTARCASLHLAYRSAARHNRSFFQPTAPNPTPPTHQPPQSSNLSTHYGHSTFAEPTANIARTTKTTRSSEARRSLETRCLIYTPLVLLGWEGSLILGIAKLGSGHGSGPGGVW
jgi:hypothetical protein